MRDCPVRLKRRQLQTTQSASIAAQTVEVARLTALLATTPPPATATPSAISKLQSQVDVMSASLLSGAQHFDPYHQFGPGADK
jgi:hypothetical protein